MGGWHPDATQPFTKDGAAINDVAFPQTMLGVAVEMAEGLLDQPELRVENRVRVGRHGVRRGRLKAGARAVTLSGILFGLSRVDVEARKAQLQALLAPSDSSSTWGFVHPVHGAQQITGRVEQPLQWGDAFELGASGPHVGVRWLVGITAHDPRRYAAAVTSATSSSISTGGGFSAPLTAPLAVDGDALGGTTLVPAGGNFERPAVLRINGPAVNPIVEDASGASGLKVVFDGVSIASGDYILVDTDEHTARMYYGASPGFRNVYGFLDFNQSTIVNLPPEAVSLRLRGAVISDPASLVVVTRDAYI